RLADEADPLTGGDAERDPRHERANLTLRGCEVHPQVGGGHNRGTRGVCVGHALTRVRLVGSETSRSPSAMKFMPSTRMTSAIPGAIAPAGAMSTVPCASCSSRPQDAFGGGAPSPRYDRL